MLQFYIKIKSCGFSYFLLYILLFLHYICDSFIFRQNNLFLFQQMMTPNLGPILYMDEVINPPPCLPTPLPTSLPIPSPSLL